MPQQTVAQLPIEDRETLLADTVDFDRNHAIHPIEEIEFSDLEAYVAREIDRMYRRLANSGETPPFWINRDNVGLQVTVQTQKNRIKQAIGKLVRRRLLEVSKDLRHIRPANGDFYILGAYADKILGSDLLLN